MMIDIMVEDKVELIRAIDTLTNQEISRLITLFQNLELLKSDRQF